MPPRLLELLELLELLKLVMDETVIVASLATGLLSMKIFLVCLRLIIGK